MSSNGWQLAAGVLLIVGGAALFVAGYSMGGLAAAAVGIMAALGSK